MIKERPIIFGGESIPPILTGDKTQTRRVIKPQPGEPTDPPQVCDITPGIRCPYGQPGDRLWVRETFALLWPDLEPVPPQQCNVEYRADNPTAKYPGGWPEEEGGDLDCPRWGSPIHMPRWASRITLEIVRIRVERLKEITEADAIAEGLFRWKNAEGKTYFGINRPDVWESDPRLTFKRLWNGINAKRGYGWDQNPWVWVVEFRRIQP